MRVSVSPAFGRKTIILVFFFLFFFLFSLPPGVAVKPLAGFTYFLAWILMLSASCAVQIIGLIGLCDLDLCDLLGFWPIVKYRAENFRQSFLGNYWVDFNGISHGQVAYGPTSCLPFWW